MISGNYKNTKLLLLKHRKEMEAANQRPASRSPQPIQNESRVIQRGLDNYGPSYPHFDSRLQRPIKPESNAHPITNNIYRPYTPDRPVDNNRHRSTSQVSIHSTRSANWMPEYKYIGKSEKKVFANKADLRFDITDINNKKRKFKYSFERENPRDKQKLLTYLKAQNLDKYSRELPVRQINEVVDYHRGIYRPEESKFMEGNPNGNSYAVHQNNSTYKRIDKMKMLLRKEAHNLIGDNAVIVRGGGSRTPDHNGRHNGNNTGKSDKRGFK